MNPSAQGTAIRDAADNLQVSGSRKTIPSLYAVSFLFLVAMVVGFIWHDLRAAYRNTLDYWNVRLSNSADERVRMAALWRSERRMDIEVISKNPLTARLLSASGKKEITVTQRGVQREIETISRSHEYLGGAALDGHCRIVVQVGIRPEMASGVQDACRWIEEGDEFRVDASGIEQGHLRLNLSAPVFAVDRVSPHAQVSRRKVGVVVMVCDPWRAATPLIAFESDRTLTSETLFVWRNESEAFIFSPRLHAQGGESLFRRPLDGPVFESRAARESDVAFGEFIDYRGVRIFGAARQIAMDRDSLARKVDRDEALSDYRRRVAWEGLLGALCVLLLGSVMVALHRHAAMRDFEERVRQQKALRENERRYRILFESAGDAIFLTRAGRVSDCNQKALELFGCARGQLIGQTLSALSPPQQPDGSDSQEAAREKTNLALEGHTLHFEWRHCRQEGTPFDAEVTLSGLKIAGKVHLLALVNYRAQAGRGKEALRRSQEELQSVTASIPDYLWSGEVDGRGEWRYRYYSSVVEKITGRPAEFYLQGPEAWLSTVHPEDRARMLECHERIRAGQLERDDNEYRIILPDGSVRWVLDSARVQRENGGIRVDGVVSDITARKWAEDALGQSDQRYRDFISHSTEGVWRFELEQPIPIGLPEEESAERFLRHGYVAECNLAFALTLGFSTPQEVVGKHYQDLLPFSDSDHERMESFRSAARDGWRSRTVEFRALDKVGNWKCLLRTEVPIVENGMLVRVWGVTRDVTELRRAEEELHRSFDQLRALTARLESIREEERKRVAREIHDQLGQALTAIKIDLSALVR